ncbi:hypothetical protein PVAP13_6NG211200 [Panicum virgatum]|uniref:Uncharacterized protein n=1 Tax=Panicum virgatum TaxID=38727 RepID=A0A8T0QYR3_PANVG|nr:hypothetical protein PVAP13_6NG211200 [Panicum virgatum]
MGLTRIPAKAGRGGAAARQGSTRPGRRASGWLRRGQPGRGQDGDAARQAAAASRGSAARGSLQVAVGQEQGPRRAGSAASREEADGEKLVPVAPNILSVEHALERMELVRAYVEKVRVNLRTGHRRHVAHPALGGEPRLRRDPPGLPRPAQLLRVPGHRRPHAQDRRRGQAGPRLRRHGRLHHGAAGLQPRVLRQGALLRPRRRGEERQ